MKCMDMKIVIILIHVIERERIVCSEPALHELEMVSILNGT